MTRIWDDTRPVYYGSTVERNAFDEVGEASGALFWDWDEDVLYMWDGAAWQSNSSSDAQYVVLALDATLDNERVLTGTANQITVTDGGAGGNVTLSTPQDIDTTATPEFDGMTISSTDGIDYNPGSDVDTDIVTVGVTGTPRLYWDESADAFRSTNGVRIDDTLGIGIDPQATYGIALYNTGLGIALDALIQSGANSNLFRVRPNGAPAANLVQWSFNLRSNNEDFWIFGYNGTTFKNMIKWEYNDGGTANTRFSEGTVAVGDFAATAKLHVDQSSATGAIPVLTLDQADVDQVLMKVIGSADAASADRTLVADSDYGTPGALTGWIQVEIQDDGNRVADGDYYIPFYAVPT